MVKTNCDAPINEKRSAKAKKRYRVSVRYKDFLIASLLLTSVEKNAVVHFLYVISRAMKSDNGKCPYYYKVEEQADITPAYCGEG